MDASDIESIDNDPLSAMSCLCKAAMFYETLLTRCLEARPELIKQVVVPELESADRMNAVVKHWRQYLEITDL